MRRRLVEGIGVAVVFVVLVGLLWSTRGPTAGAVNAGENGAPRTAWGDPDLQAIWTDPYQTPVQRPAKYADKEFFTDEERAALDEQRAAIPRRDKRVERGTERDVAGAYNATFQSVKPTAKRTSLVV